jgi:hypothetical protein
VVVVSCNSILTVITVHHVPGIKFPAGNPFLAIEPGMKASSDGVSNCFCCCCQDFLAGLVLFVLWAICPCHPDRLSFGHYRWYLVTSPVVCVTAERGDCAVELRFWVGGGVAVVVVVGCGFVGLSAVSVGFCWRASDLSSGVLLLLEPRC